MEERRKAPRIKSLKGGRIIYLNGSATRDCAIRNLSASGAKLILDNIVGIPDQFNLQFEDGTQRHCTIRWKKLSELGVEFKEITEADAL
ncbi:MAG: hypothetical protein ABS35_36510 [Kaistia sp. SCN 65-12]|uniref:PilZ domain-containing protein n=1 Tax=Rhodoligotrophos defluvii TaxID=2561934 RepID=UPI00086D0A28|nr:PilZ domain-containing protein [Rhodoligotrophos defluvii]ODT13897.1 MAG: hypothetical protein ABS35_36510 [Kaistia sp. SCN 65-12]